MSTAKTMAEVLADKLAELDELTDGDGFTYSWFDMEKIDLAEELTLALSAAGFGLVTDTKAEALEEAAADFMERVAVTRNTTRYNGTAYATATLNHAYGMEMASTALRARAAALRGDS